MFPSNPLDATATTRAGALAALLALSLANTAQAAQAPALPRHPAGSPTFTMIDDPADPTFNQLLGINNNGVISGYFGSGAIGHPNKGYTIAPPYKSFVSDNLPASTQTQATGINDFGTTSGFWAPTNLGSGDANYGFLHYGGLYLSVNYTPTTGSPVGEQLLGVNNNYIAVGFQNDAAGHAHGFAYNLRTEVYTSLDYPTVMANAATGISNANVVCGFYTKSNGATDGYVKPLVGGTLLSFRVPGTVTTQFLGINSSQTAVGFYLDANMIPHGVIYSATSKTYALINDPNGAQGTTLNGINDKGQIVGFYVDAAGNTHGVLITGATP